MLLLATILLLCCLLGAAFAAGIETGLVSLNRLRLQHQLRRRVPGARTVRWFLAHPGMLLSTTLIATNLLYVAAAVLAAAIGNALAGPAGSAAAGVLLTLVVLVCCEYLPKSWFQASPSTRVLPFAPLLRVVAVLLAPLSIPVNAILRLLTRQPASDPDADRLLVSREELLTLAREGVQSGVLTPAETEMIRGVFALTHKTCVDLMVPRDRIVSVPATATVPEFLALARAHDFSRYPLYDPATRSWTGVVHVLDVLADPSPAPTQTVSDYAHPPQLVAGNTPADHLLPRMRVTNSPLFLVTDSRYEVIGLITLEDVLTEITGE
ncbi:MAG: DUF21 domain-containing protein [Kiritimatiellae bacterium]|nr:DUF21 domain-containing protein [Kiritimatiellia bacterium]